MLYEEYKKLLVSTWKFNMWGVHAAHQLVTPACHMYFGFNFEKSFCDTQYA